MSSQPQVPSPQPVGAGVGLSIDQMIAARMGQLSATAKPEDMPIIPLWKVRPASSATSARRSGAGSSAAADHAMPSTGAGSANAAEHAGTGDPTSGAVTMDAAEVYWMSMSQEDRIEFSELAQKAGLWKRSLGADALAQAWAKAVGWAGKYNSLHKDETDKWMSPFEAATNMAIAGMADDDLAHDGFSTETTIQQFTVSQLTAQARQILQSELGRNPTDSELKVYTSAVNAAARANPQQVTMQQTDNMDGSKATDRVVTGGIDPTEIIQGMAQDSQESADFKTAAMYLPALQQAITGSMQLG